MCTIFPCEQKEFEEKKSYTVVNMVAWLMNKKISIPSSLCINSGSTNGSFFFRNVNYYSQRHSHIFWIFFFSWFAKREEARRREEKEKEKKKKKKEREKREKEGERKRKKRRTKRERKNGKDRANKWTHERLNKRPIERG